MTIRWPVRSGRPTTYRIHVRANIRSSSTGWRCRFLRRFVEPRSSTRSPHGRQELTLDWQPLARAVYLSETIQPPHGAEKNPYFTAKPTHDGDALTAAGCWPTRASRCAGGRACSAWKRNHSYWSKFMQAITTARISSTASTGGAVFRQRRTAAHDSMRARKSTSSLQCGYDLVCRLQHA